MIKLQKILVPADFSNNNAPAVLHGCELARRFGAELHLLHIVEPSGGLQSMPQLPDDVALDLLTSSPYARSEIRLQSMPNARGITVVRHVEIGRPHVEIVRYAQQHDIDLIVIGTHGHTGWEHVLLGSVAENVVQHSKCPVLTVHSKPNDDKSAERVAEEHAATAGSTAVTRQEQTLE